MAIKFDNIEAESLLNSQGELTITLTDDQGITVPGAVQSASVTATGTVQGSYVTANNTSGAADGSAQEVARFVNTRSAATSGYIYIGAASGTDWRLGKNINGTAGNTNFGITKHSGTDIFLEIDGSGNTSILGDVFSDGLYVNSTSAVSGTQVAIVQDGNQNLQRWGSSSDGTTQASYRFRIDQNFKFIGNSGGGDTLTLDSTNGSATFTGSISASNFSGSSSGTNTGDQDLSSYLTTVSFSDLTGKPTTLSGYGIIDGASLGLDQVFTGDTEFEADLLRTNQRISNNQEYPLGHYTPGETVFELNTTWSNRELRQYFGNDNVSWDEVANAPGGYAVYIDGSVSVGGAYNSGFPYIPIDQDGIYYMECWIKNAGTAQGHYMGSIDYEADFTAPASGAGNPGSYGYFVMSNYTGAAEWTKVSGYITGHHNSNTGAFETDATYWTPQALFNYSAGSGTRACWISGWKVIRVDHVGDRTFQDDVKVKGKLEVHTLDANTTSTTALVMNGNEVEKRTLGSNAFNSTSFLTSVDFTDIGGATRTNYTLKFKPNTSNYAGFQFLGTDSQNAGYFLIRGTSDDGVYTAEGITLVADQGWLTLAQRTASDKGIRFLTGTGATNRMTIASDGDVNINNNLTVEADLGVNGFIKDSFYKHVGNTNWRTSKSVRSVGITGSEIADSWVQLSRVTIGSSYEKVTIKFTINGYDDVSSGVEAIDVRYENGASAQENHQMAWYSTDDHANLFKNVRSIRSSSSGLSNTYDLYVQMAGDWRDSFTVVAESWTTHAGDSPITYITAAGSANEPSAGSNDIERTERRWYTENSFMYLGANRVYTTGDFATSDFTYSAGTLLDLSSNTFNVDLSELTNNTATFAPTQDHFVILDNGVQGKKLASSIFGSAAYEASSAFATASHNHAGVYVPEYEALQPTGSDKEMNVWRKTHAVWSDSSGASTYIILQTEVPQDNYSMGGFTLVYQDNYYDSGEGGEIKIYGYWNPESNGGFEGFRYECSNPYHTPTIEVCRNSSSGNTAFFISGEGANYTQLIAKDLWLGYTASSATSQWGNGWVVSQADNKNGYTNFNTLNRNDFPAITTDGSTPSLTGGVDAAEVRTLIGAQVAGSYLTAHPSITEAADVNNSGGTVIQDLTFDDNGHVTATGSVNLDAIYTSTDGTDNDYRFTLNLSSFSGTRWYKVATVNTGSGGLRIRGMMTNHVESFGSNMIDLAIQGREGNNSDNIEVTGHVHVLHENVGIAIYSGEKPSYYRHWDVYVVATQYTQCQLDLTQVSGSFDTSGNYVTTEPSGTLELETYQLSEGNYVIRDSAAKRIFDSGINLAGGLSYTPSTNTLTQTDNNTTYNVATTSADGLMSSTDKTKLDGVATGADVTPSWVPANDPSYLTALPTHNHDDRYFRRYTGQAASISSNGYRTAFTVDGGNLASSIRVSLQGTSNGVVVSNVLDILVNHYQDIVIESNAGVYTRLYVKVISNNNEDFAVELKTDNAQAVTLDIEVLAYGNETVTFATSHSYTGSTLELDCEPGKTFKATGGDSGDIKTYGVFKGDGSGLTGITKAATVSDQASPTATIQVGAGTSNTSNRSGVALLGDANAGGVVNALGLVNTATAANSNGVALNFHNANNYSPTGQILLQQNSSGTTTHSAMKFFTYGSNNLTHQMSIKSDGTIRFLSYGAGFIKSDSSGNLSVDTSTYLTGIAANSVGIGELNVSDGSAGQVLTTDGNGTLSFATVSSGSSYTLPAATSSALGGVKIGYTANAKNYPVQLDASNKAYVNVPWTDANTTYSAGSGLDLSSNSFSVEADLRDGITHVGKDANNYIQFDSTNGRIDFYAGGNFVARMESDGDLHIKGDVIAFSNIFG